jgi:uncharacterized protein (TIGR03435 family)
MREDSDMDLIRSYVAHRSELAFETIVNRYVNLVYSVALRQVRDAHLAQEVTQAVFVIFARKASSLGPKTILPSWLYRTACFAAQDALKAEHRRQQREHEAFMQASSGDSGQDSNETWNQIEPLLDTAMAGLSEKDRHAIVLRFFQDKSLDEIGRALGANENAARMRVNRALERLRDFFAKRGVAAVATTIGAALAVHSVQAAPAGLATTIAANGAVAGGSTLTLIKGALKLMAWSKAKTALMAGTGLLLAVGTTTVAVNEIRGDAPYEWQVPKASFDVLRQTVPQARITPSRYTEDGGQVSQDEMVLGIGRPMQRVILAAYRTRLARAILPAALPEGLFDFIANLPTGSAEALQQELKNEFGLTARRVEQDADVLVLKIKDAARAKEVFQQVRTPNLRSGQSQRVAMRASQGNMAWSEQPVSVLASFLEDRIVIPVIDRTGLDGRYSFSLAWNSQDGKPAKADTFQEALLAQLGLELVPNREKINVLVVEKLKE